MALPPGASAIRSSSRTYLTDYPREIMVTDTPVTAEFRLSVCRTPGEPTGINDRLAWLEKPLGDAFEMVFERRQQRREKSAERAITKDVIHNIAAFPLAIPLMASYGYDLFLNGFSG